MISTFRVELGKQLRRPRTYVALGAMALVPVLMTLGIKFRSPHHFERGRDNFFYLATLTGIFVPVAALELMSRVLLVFTVSVFAGDAVAGEASWGNLRYLLLRPLRRGRLLGAKLATAALLALAAAVVISLVGLAAGTIAFGWHPLPAIFGFAGIPHSPGELVANLGIATAYVAWSLAGVIAFGFMVSTMTDTAAGAIGAAVGLYIVSQILDAITTLGSIRYALPTHYLDAWTRLFTGNGSAGAEMLRGVLLQVPYLLVFTGVAWWWFGRKDILS